MKIHRRGAAKPVVVIVLFVLAAAGMWIGYAGIARNAQGPQLPMPLFEDPDDAMRAAAGDLEVREFLFRDEFGRPVTEQVFDGKWTLLSFGFSNCQLACPPMHANIMRLQTKFASTPMRFITMSVDPVHDTPARLNEFMEQRSTLGSSWSFLSTEEEGLLDVLQGLGLAIFDDASEANVIDLGEGNRMNNIGHPTRFILIGPDRRVVDIYEGEDAALLDETTSSIRSHMARAEREAQEG